MSLLNRLRFAFWYLRRPPWDTGISPPELLAFLNDCPPGRAIDLGCGTGTNVITLARLGWQVDGVDFVPQAIQRAMKRVEQAGVQAALRRGDVTKLDGIEGPYDLALDLGCFHGLLQKEKLEYLGQLKRILARGGIWFVYAFLIPDMADESSGLSTVDLERIFAQFTLQTRIDGYDRRNRPSAYFIFKR